MISSAINQAMIFAAGKGVRMMPLTADRPKPMLEVLGRPLLGHALESVAAAGINRVVVNTHHCPEAIRSYVPSYVKISHEPVLLETGGGVKKALAEGLLSDKEPLLAVNADILCTDGATPAIARLSQEWGRLGSGVDVLLLLVPKAKAWGHDSDKADYNMATDGRLERLSNPQAEYVYAGLQILRPDLYGRYTNGDVFTNRDIFDTAQKAGRLYGLVHDGGWFHFSTPQSLDLFHRQALPAAAP